LLVEKSVQRDEIGDHMVQNVVLLTASFQIPHAGLPDLSPDSWREKSHWCGNEVLLEDSAQVAEGLPDSQRVSISMSKSCSGHSPWLDVGVAGASGDGKDYPTAKSAEVFVLSAVVPWALSHTKAFQGVDQKAGKTRLFLANALGPTCFIHLKTE